MKEKKLDKDAIIASGQTEKDIQIDRQLAKNCHLLGLVTGIVGPLIFCLTKKDDADFLQHHEREALNFQLTMLFSIIMAVVFDFFVFNHMYFIPVVIITDITLSITAVIKAEDDVYYKYPISIPFLRAKKPNSDK